MKDKLTIDNIKKRALEIVSFLKPYKLAIFVVFVLFSYGFLLLQLNTLMSSQPSPDLVSQQIKGTAVPRIDRNIVKKIKSLQDNSVSVKTLFEQARNNPFQ